MTGYKIIADMTADLPMSFYEEHNVEVLEYEFSIDEDQYSSMSEISIDEFYKQMRDGRVTRTSQLSHNKIENAMRKYLDQDLDVIMFVLSSGLSGSFSNATMVSKELSEAYPDRKIYVVDTLAASMGEGLFVNEAVSKYEEGCSIDELYNWAEEIKHNVVQLFTVDDLMFLHRGGRVSKTAAIAGSLLGIKPALHVDDAGKLIPVGKIRGRRNALDDLVNRMAKQLGDFKNSYVMISHGDCLLDAQYVANEIKTKIGVKKSIINHIGPVIGSHSGPGTVALFFFGKVR